MNYFDAKQSHFSRMKSVTTLRGARLLLIIALLMQLSGCAVTKVATVPLRVGGDVISIVPVVGHTTDKVIDGAADIVDR